jgi:hypothetical protein
VYQAIGAEIQARQASVKAVDIIQALATNIDGEGLRARLLRVYAG